MARRQSTGDVRGKALYSVTLGALALGACQLGTDDAPGGNGAGRGSMPGAGGAGVTGGTSGAGTGGTIMLTGGAGGSLVITGGAGGTVPTGAGGTGAVAPYLSPESHLSFPQIAAAPAEVCSSDPAENAWPFCGQSVWNVAPAKRVLYSWTTAEQAAELRRDHVLLTRTETAGLGRGYAFTSIDELAAMGTGPENRLLAALSSELFVKVRYAWPNAWATRMGWPGEDYGDQLLRIVLKPEAWILVVSDKVGIAVIDLDNNLVPIADAVAHPERIGAVYFYKQDVTGSGSFFSCSGGYREFIVGNEAMVEEWSLGTEQLRDQIETDATLVERFLTLMRAAPTAATAANFNQQVACSWDGPVVDAVSSYERALGIPSENYVPLPAQLASLAETLRASLFEPDPLIVTPGG